MKKHILSLVALLIISSTAVFAQVKIGYTSAAQILPQLPEFKTKQSELESYAKVLENQMKSQQQEFQQKYQAYLAEAEKLAPVARQAKEKELQTLDQNLQEFAQSAQQDIQKKEQSLLKPLYDRIQVAIDAVGKANGYTLILNAFDGTNSANLLYAAETVDVTNMVLKELGVEPSTDGK